MRKKISYTVEECVVNKFDNVCKENGINKSALIEILIGKWLIEVNKEKK